jgi:predicted RNase H-like HicB family nuclease
MRIMKAITWKEGKFYVTQGLNVDVSSFGRTEKAALKNLKEALEVYFEDSSSHKKVSKVERPKVVSLSVAHA